MVDSLLEPGCLEDESCQKMVDDMFGSGENSMDNFARGLMPQLQGEHRWDKMPTVPGVDSKLWKTEEWKRFFVNLVKNIARLLMYVASEETPSGHPNAAGLDVNTRGSCGFVVR